MSELICILVRLRWGQFCYQISHVSKQASLYSVSCLQCSSPTQRVWIEIWIIALFCNQRYKSGPKALIPTYSQVVSIKSSVGLSNLKYYTSMWSVKGIRIAFQVCLLLEDMGGPEKDWVLFQHHTIFLASFSMYSSCQLDASWHNCNSFGVNCTQVGIFKQPN